MTGPFDTDLVKWLRRQPGRCRVCGAHIATQGHADGCPRKDTKP